MIQPDDVTSLTDFKRDTPAHLRRLRKTGRPCILTINGKAAAVVLDPKTYAKLARQIEHAEVIAGIQRGLDDFAAGRAKPARAALEATFAKLRAARRRRKNGKSAA